MLCIKDTKTDNTRQAEPSKKVSWATKFINFSKDKQCKTTELLRLAYKRSKTVRNILINKNYNI